MNKKGKLFGAIGVIIFILYNILVFAIGGFADHEAPFWISYAFVIIGFLTVAVSAVLLGQEGMAMKDWLFGYPIVRHCVIYCVLELVVSMLFMAFEYDVSPVLAFVVQVILLSVYLIFVISCFISKTAVDEVHQKVETKNRYISLLKAESDLNCQKCTDPVVLTECRKLSEAIRYSDPMSNAALANLEQRLLGNVTAIGAAIDEGNYTLAKHLCDQAQLLLSERNMKTKALK